MTWRLRELREDPLTLCRCRYCDRQVRRALAEHCWYCGEALCVDCWEEVGHCGHPEAYLKNRELVRRLMLEQQ